MDKIIILLLLLIVSHPIFALSCNTIEPTINLSDPGGVLYPLRATNQNGLGTCYIEQLHKLIKARLPGHPDLSRIQMAILEKKVRDQNLLVKHAVRYKDGNTVATYVDIGSSCNAFNKIKGNPICPAKFEQFEQLTNSNPDDQEKILGTLAVYFDSRPDPIINPNSSLYSINTNFSDDRLNKAFKACLVSKAMTERLNLACREHFNYLKQSKSNFLLQFLPPNFNFKNFTSEDLAMSGEEFTNGKSYLDYLNSLVPLSKVDINNPTGQKLKSELENYAHEMENQEVCVASFWRSRPSVLTCNATESAQRSAVKSLMKFGFKLRDITKFLNGSYDRDKLFETAFACTSSKYKIPNNIDCKTIDLENVVKDYDSLNSYQKYVSSLLDQQLKKQTPIGISSCTRFFNNPNARTMNLGSDGYNCGDKKAKGYVDGEGAHAITIIGSRCQNGVKQYLVQNSWGDGCFYSDQYECTHKGGFWAPAESVINNIRELDFLE